MAALGLVAYGSDDDESVAGEACLVVSAYRKVLSKSKARRQCDMRL